MKTHTHNKRESAFNQMVYEIRPWIFVAIGVVALFKSTNSALMFGSGVVMIFAASMILHYRTTYRSKSLRKHRR